MDSEEKDHQKGMPEHRAKSIWQGVRDSNMTKPETVTSEDSTTPEHHPRAPHSFSSVTKNTKALSSETGYLPTSLHTIRQDRYIS